ncbi:hypothetical protein BpHYR1_018117 [Brachionus plicatilis]|uniref:Uncharacterized protein n=1 Tax=Brachionus plicatilis TaxID=10195 RepID=A0A3M7QL22_BRAPC|nr:hypothetical protein BpHYR1_018117 [Brachionus plicatilis]
MRGKNLKGYPCSSKPFWKKINSLRTNNVNSQIPSLRTDIENINSYIQNKKYLEQYSNSSADPDSTSEKDDDSEKEKEVTVRAVSNKEAIGCYEKLFSYFETHSSDSESYENDLDHLAAIKIRLDSLK